VNVKEVALTEDIGRYASLQLQVDARALGPRLGKEMQNVIRAAKAGEWKSLGDGRVKVAGQVLEEDEYALRLKSNPGIACQSLASQDAIAILDLEVSDDLAREGLARDVVRLVQQARRESGLHVSDRIDLALELPDGPRTAALQFREYIAEQTLAVDVQLEGPLEDAGMSIHEGALGDQSVRIALRRTASPA
jgi:isoleucyl-tRNA synthetase